MKKVPLSFFEAAALLVLLVLAAAAPAVQAGDEGVYGPVAPPNSAFLRVFNGTAGGSLEGKIADKLIADIPALGASEFVFLPPGQYTLTVGDKSLPVSLKKDVFYTAALTSEGIRLMDTGRFGNRLKSLVILYNLTDSPALNLRTGDGRKVVEPVAANSAASREVNAVKVNLELYDGDHKIASAKPVNLERGKAFSLFVMGSKGSPSSVWAVN